MTRENKYAPIDYSLPEHSGFPGIDAEYQKTERYNEFKKTQKIRSVLTKIFLSLMIASLAGFMVLLAIAANTDVSTKSSPEYMGLVFLALSSLVVGFIFFVATIISSGNDLLIAEQVFLQMSERKSFQSWVNRRYGFILNDEHAEKLLNGEIVWLDKENSIVASTEKGRRYMTSLTGKEYPVKQNVVV